MTSDEITALSTESCGTATERNRTPIDGYAMFEELSFLRREAQAEAHLAYEDWSHHPGTVTYTVYRAAQDRADAAQDALADWVHRR